MYYYLNVSDNGVHRFRVEKFDFLDAAQDAAKFLRESFENKKGYENYEVSVFKKRTVAIEIED